MKKVLVIGGSGMVASRIIDLAKDKLDITSADEKTLDITDKDAVSLYFENNHFDAVVNFAAFTNVDAAETQKDDQTGLVWRLNVLGSSYIADVCRQKNIFLVHISTDFVFPGDQKYPGPYAEDAEIPEKPDNLGWYAWSKNRAEKMISESGCKYAIIRYGYPFRADKYDLKLDWARNLLKLYNEQKLYPLFADQIQSVVFIDEMVTPFIKIISEEVGGIFHLVSRDTTTPYEIGSYLLEKYIGKAVSIQKGSMVEFLEAPGRTPRPRLGGLKVEASEKLLDIKFKSWREMVDEFIKQIN